MYATLKKIIQWIFESKQVNLQWREGPPTEDGGFVVEYMVGMIRYSTTQKYNKYILRHFGPIPKPSNKVSSDE
jgi:hypothetical protein